MGCPNASGSLSYAENPDLELRRASLAALLLLVVLADDLDPALDGRHRGVGLHLADDRLSGGRTRSAPRTPATRWRATPKKRVR